MANWEYKVISSGKGGFASPALMEKFINDLGQQQWEIIYFHTAADNQLAFNGLARRPTQRDWTLEDAAAAAARAETDKLRVEFEAKFKSATGTPAAAEEDKADAFLGEEKAGADDGLRRLRDTSRDDDPDAPEEEAGTSRDEWEKLAEEDELPSFFDAMKPHMRRNQRGPGMSVGVDFLAKKWKLEESDVKGALVECGMQIPTDENARPVFVEYDGDLFWVNINRRGEIWINTREKPQPVFRVVPGKRLTEEEMPESAPAPASAPAHSHAQSHSQSHAPREEDVRHAPAQQSHSNAPAQNHQQRAPAPAGSFLGKLRGLMRRNRRGHGWSGSFGFLTKALKLDEATLLAQLGEQGVRLQADGDQKPSFHEEGEFLYWLNKNHRGEVWINARKSRGSQHGDDGQGDGDQGESGEYHAGNASEPVAEAPAAAAPVSAPEPAPARDPGNTLAAVRLLLQPKKRGEGVAALIPEVASQLGQTEEALLAALADAGVTVPADAKAKPTFGENAGEIFWLNKNARGELWLNAKASMAAKKSRSRKAAEEPAEA